MKRQSLLHLAASLVLGCLLVAGPVIAQNTGEIQGRVTYEGGPMPGVTVTASSPSLLGGSQTVITGVNGDYKLPFLSPGEYRVVFVLDQFKTLEQVVKVSSASTKTVDAVMIPQSVSEEIVVTGNYETVSAGAQASSTVEQDVLEKLAVNRNITQATALSAGVTQTGPSDAITIAGSMSYENLFTMNGVVLNENLRGQPFDMFIEDAIQETTVITSGVSAEYGRFGGGVVNMITKSGGNEFSGSYRLNLTNDDWSAKTDLTPEQTDEVNKVHEATLGGFLWKDHLWFFLAGRDMKTTTSNEMLLTNTPFVSTNPERRLEGKLTFSPSSRHRILGSYTEVEEDQTNYSFGPLPSMTWDAIDPIRSLPLEGMAFNYTGVITDNFFVEALYSKRDFTFMGSGGDAAIDDYGHGMPVWDYYAGSGLFNAPWFCGRCADEERNNENVQAKGSYFLGTDTLGTHDFVFGYDAFEDTVISNNWQSATGYALLTFFPQVYNSDGSVTAVVPSFGAEIIWGAVLENSAGSQFETKSVYLNDTWRFNDRLTFNLGLRYDQNDATDAGGLQVANDDRISPRLAMSWDLFADGEWVVNAALARYVSALSYGIGDAGAAAGNPTWAFYYYGGPDLNTGCQTDNPATCMTNAEVLESVMDWFLNVYGGPSNTDLADGSADIPGLTPRMDPNGLSSPYTDEYSIGVSKRLGSRGMIRTDYVHREGGSYYASRIDRETGQVTHPLAGTLDIAYRFNDNDFYERKYDGLMTRFSYRLSDKMSAGANWTWSHTRGNLDGENAGSGPVSGTFFEYPEYRRAEWNAPKRDLNIDQRHVLRAWFIWDLLASERQNLSFSLLQNYWSGAPYPTSPSQLVHTYNANTGEPYVVNPGYENPPSSVNYYFGRPGSFTTDDITRTDIAINYSFYLDLFGTELELFIQPEVINLFNEDGLVDCGGACSQILTRYNSASMEPFNPYTETPVQGVHWDYGPSWGQPINENDFQQARTFRLSLGVRF